MFNVVLVHPEIPPNTGNVIRLCANTGCTLHLIEPLGFSMDDKLMRRAGLDYHEYADVRRYPHWVAFLQQTHPEPDRLFALTTRGQRGVHEVSWQAGDWLVFGPEWPEAGHSGIDRPRPLAAPAHAAGSAQPQPVQRRGHHRFRGLAPERLSRRVCVIHITR
jgi:tRNA (cytidine/uridine-2'-O-)-methyltransferase